VEPPHVEPVHVEPVHVEPVQPATDAWIPLEANPYGPPAQLPGPAGASGPYGPADQAGATGPAGPWPGPADWADPWQAVNQPPQAERQPGTDGFAITAFVLSLFSLVLFSVGFAIVALRRIGRTHKGGRGLAIAALVVSGLWVMAAVTVVVVRDQPKAAVRASNAGPSAGSSGGVVAAGQIDASQVRVGDCVQSPSGNAATVSTLDAVPCSAPHDDEAYFVGNIAGTSTYPGDKAVQNDADSICGSAFQAYVGISIDQSSLNYEFLYPGPDQWRSGDYSVTCFVTTGSKSTGSLRNSHR
jgi:hypothetical protein